MAARPGKVAVRSYGVVPAGSVPVSSGAGFLSGARLLEDDAVIARRADTGAPPWSRALTTTATQIETEAAGPATNAMPCPAVTVRLRQVRSASAVAFPARFSAMSDRLRSR
ncbi:hypothetical protein ACI2L1_26040 [Streptomyces sp. NPDC019531]|uniref:hypothetical protein n=1 Tax=Streptomyces sp. NPDC019531 TaxID=3365062 RepID=UPI003850BCF6